MKKRVLPSVLAALALLFVTACSKSGKADAAPPDTAPALITGEEAAEVYDLYVKGDYAAYVDRMLSCRDKSAEYRRQMVWLYKQHAADRREGDGDVESVEVARIEATGDGRAAEVCLNVTYTNHEKEEILLQFVYSDGKWYLR